MQSRAPLMKEHRLIERMLSSLETVLAEIESARRIDPTVIDAAVDFIRTYADRTHHGKEEDILFAELGARPLSAADRRAMEELIADHEFARRETAGLVRAGERYRHGGESALSDIGARIRMLCDFYPVHIAKEDKAFFAVARAYFTDDEDQDLLVRYREFDRTMIHEKYASVVEGLEQRARHV
jgi:hemerythrin-like domain-containing protein